MTKTVWAVYRRASQEDASIYHFHDPELLPVALLLKASGRRVVYDAHEDLPKQILGKEWLPTSLRRPISALSSLLESVAAKILDGVVAATPAIARRFRGHKCSVVQNFPIQDELAARSDAAIPYEMRESLVAYVGGLSAIRGARQMIRAMELLPESSEAKLLIAGKITPPGLEDELRGQPGWRRVEALGWRSRAEVADLLGRARVGLLLFQPLPNHLESYPTKLFEYMSAGLPVVVSDFPLWRDIIDEVGCGMTVDPTDPAAVAETLQDLLVNTMQAAAMGHRGKVAVQERFSWDGEARKLIALYERTLAVGASA
jgi:glycosyltransferase involved in cell wall biosynthesis